MQALGYGLLLTLMISIGQDARDIVENVLRLPSFRSARKCQASHSSCLRCFSVPFTFNIQRRFVLS